MANKYVNKVIIGKEVKLDLTADSVTPDKLAKGITAHDKTGAPITGTSTKDVDSTDATAAVAEVLDGKTFYARGAKMTGTMPNNGAVAGKITQKDGKYTIRWASTMAAAAPPSMRPSRPNWCLPTSARVSPSWAWKVPCPPPRA